MARTVGPIHWFPLSRRTARLGWSGQPGACGSCSAIVVPTAGADVGVCKVLSSGVDAYIGGHCCPLKPSWRLRQPPPTRPRSRIETSATRFAMVALLSLGVSQEWWPQPLDFASSYASPDVLGCGGYGCGADDDGVGVGADVGL